MKGRQSKLVEQVSRYIHIVNKLKSSLQASAIKQSTSTHSATFMYLLYFPVDITGARAYILMLSCLDGIKIGMDGMTLQCHGMI